MRLISKGGFRHSLTVVKDSKQSITEFTYNGDGLRTSKTVKASDDGYTPHTTNYLYDGQHVVQEDDGLSATAVLLESMNASMLIKYYETETYSIFSVNDGAVDPLIRDNVVMMFMNPNLVKNGSDTYNAGQNRSAIDISASSLFIHELVHANRLANEVFNQASINEEEAWAIYVQNQVIYEINQS